MINKRLFVIAYSNREWHTVAALMINLYYEYYEGFMESSGRTYNRLIGKVPSVVLDIMAEMQPEEKYFIDLKTNIIRHNGASIELIKSSL